MVGRFSETGCDCAVVTPPLDGAGWLNTLPFWLLSLLRRESLMHKNSKKASNARPTTDPITIPAMAPPLNPLLLLDSGAGVEPFVFVGMGGKVITGVMAGRTTPAHLLSILDW